MGRETDTSGMTGKMDVYALGDCILDVRRGAVLRNGEAQPIRPKSFDVLRVLVGQAGTLVSKNQLIDEVWHGGSVSDDSITQCIVEIRRVLGDGGKTIVRTVPRRGYILEGSYVRRMSPDEAPVLRRSGSSGPAWATPLAAGAAAIALVYLAVLAWPEGEELSEGGAGAAITAAPDRGVADYGKPASRDAYDAYLAGLYYLRDHENGESIDEMAAIKDLQKSVDLDGRWAASRAALGRAMHFYASGHPDPAERRIWFEASRKELLKAIELDAGFGPAWGSLAFVVMAHDHNFAAADAHFRRAESLNSPYPWARALYYRNAGAIEKAIEQFELAIVQYPHARYLRWQSAHALLCAGRLSESRAQLRALSDAEPDQIPVRVSLAYIAARLGETERAETLLEEMTEIDEHHMGPWKTPVLALLGRTEEAEARLQQLEHEGPFMPLLHLRTTRALGDSRRSLPYLRKSSEDPWALRYVQCPESAGDLIDDPEFAHIVRQAGFPVAGEFTASMR